MRHNGTRLGVEEMERRDLPSAVVHIDSSWIQQAAGNPILLTQPGTTYVLDQDIDVAGSAIVVGAANVTLDLNGHQVVYGDAAPLSVTNAGFEQGGQSLPGWNLHAAPGWSRVPTITGMYGQWMLQLNNIAGVQTLVSSSVAVPTANREYAAAITSKGPYGTTVQLSVVDAVTGKVLGSGTSSDPSRGFAAVARFTPTTTDAVQLRVDVTPPSGQTATVDLDYASLMTSRDYGIVATQDWTGDLPAQLLTSQFQATYRNAANFTLQNGHVIQGAGRGYASSPMFYNGLPGFTVTGVDSFANGMDTDNLDGTYGHDAVVQNSTFRAAVDRISNRMNDYAAIEFMNFSGTASVLDNQILGVPQVGVLFAGMDPMQSLTIDNNIIEQNSIVTDGYGITIAGARDFEIANNTITPTNGRGILLDGWGRIPTDTGRIHDNYLSVKETPNLEYAYTDVPVICFRVRNWGTTHKNLEIYNNTFISTTGPGGFSDAIAARFSEANYQGQTTGANNSIHDNVFKAIAATTDPNYHAHAFSFSGVDAGTGLQVSRNTFESNDTSLAFGDADSWMMKNDDISLFGNTLSLSADGPGRPYTGISAGADENEVSNIRLFNTRVINGANATIVYTGSQPKSIQTGWQLTVSGTDVGGGPDVRVFDGPTGTPTLDFNAYDARFFGGVRVATGDVNGDGVPDIITGPGPSGGPDIRVFDGNTGALLREFMAYPTSTLAGVFVAAGDVNGDGHADIIVGPDAGSSPIVKVFSGADGSLLYSFNAYSSNFMGGVRVAAGDINGDGHTDIITGAGPGGGPHVKAFSGADLTTLQSFFAYGASFSGGVYVAAGDVNGDHLADIVTGAGAGGGPHVRVISGVDGSVLQSFMAYDPTFTGGVRVSTVEDLNHYGRFDLSVAPGGTIPPPGGGQLLAQDECVLDGITLSTVDDYYAYDPHYLSGVFVGGC